MNYLLLYFVWKYWDYIPVKFLFRIIFRMIKWKTQKVIESSVTKGSILEDPLDEVLHECNVLDQKIQHNLECELEELPFHDTDYLSTSPSSIDNESH